jgi:phosphatidylserine/phosphatidylglycerophosphate/cardiolipin synthase-like enzyme
MMYQLYCQPCVSALINAKNRGVNVRVLLDYNQGSNNGAKSALQSAGVELKPSPAEFNHAHAKVLIIDHDEAVVMSANMNDYSFSSERNYGVIDHDPQDVAQLLSIFDRDWAGQGTIDTSCTRLIISPLNARQRTLEFINSAQTSLDFAVMYISDAEVLSAAKAKAAQGVPVRALFAMPEWIGENAATAAELKAAGVQTKYLYTYELHAKLVIVDGVPMVGSENMSYNSLENNREIGLLVTEPGPASQIMQQFETDWSQGVAAP